MPRPLASRALLASARMAAPVAVTVAATVAAALSCGPVAAAPQPLGLVATDAPQELHCLDGVCRGYLNALCLVRDRDTPAPGHAYAPMDQSMVRLVITHRDGTVTEAAPGDAVRFTAHRGYSTVRVDLAGTPGAREDVASAAIVVEPLATLLPQQSGADPDPITAAEVESVVKPYRQRAADFFESSGPFSDAARITGYVVNALPETRHATDRDAEAAWTRLLDGRQDRYSAQGVTIARNLVDECKGFFERGQAFDVRGCLQLRHQRMMTEINETFWDSLAAY